jgi:hypothetical protein
VFGNIYMNSVRSYFEKGRRKFMNKKAQLNGFVTIANSSKLPSDVKEQIVNPGDGKATAIRIVLRTEGGDEIPIQAKLGLSKSKGSLTGRFSIKVDNFELVSVTDEKTTKKNSTDEKQDVEALATELLGMP